jgi:hypothetical protein
MTVRIFFMEADGHFHEVTALRQLIPFCEWLLELSVLIPPDFPNGECPGAAQTNHSHRDLRANLLSVIVPSDSYVLIAVIVDVAETE